MSHYTVRYEGTKQEKLLQAREAFIDYLGIEQAEKLRTTLLHQVQDCRSLIKWCRIACDLRGMRGWYTVRAFTLFVMEGRE